MKIALVYDCIYPYSKGGVEKRLFDLAHRLSENHEVHLFGMKYWQGPSFRKSNGIYYHGVAPKMKLYNANGKRRILQPLCFSVCLFIALIRERRERFDLIDCQNIPYVPCFACKLYCWLTKTPLIITWCEIWGDYWKEYLGYKGLLGMFIEKMTSRLTEHHIAISAKTKENFHRLNPKKPITLIPVGIDWENIQRAKGAEENLDLLFAGRLIPEKNVQVLIRSLSLIERPNLKCGIIGDGPEKQRLERLAKELGVEGNIIFFGFVKDIYSYMKSAKIFVFPSQREGFGIVVLEASACGLPVVLLKHKNNASTELVQDNGYVCDDEQEIAERIGELLSDEGLRRKLSANSVCIAARYDWNHIIKEYEAFCANVLKSFC